MTDYIILSLLLVAALVGGLYLKREAVCERERRRAAREADEARRRAVVDEWLHQALAQMQAGQAVTPGMVLEREREAVANSLIPPKSR